MLRTSVAAGAALALCLPSTVALAGPHTRGGAFCGTPDVVLGIQHETRLGMGLPGATDRIRTEADCWDNPRPTYDSEQILEDRAYGFVIHYTTDRSDDAAVTLSEVNRVAQVMRDVIDLEQGDMDLLAPPRDGIDADYYCDTGPGADGGSDLFDVYFIDDDDLYGYAQPLTDLDEDSGAATSFLALSTWILDYAGALEVTVAHEYFHSIQFTYDSYEDAAWMETTATWMEEQAYDDVNDYLGYVDDAFESPELPLDTFDEDGVIQYGNAIWPLFLTQTQPQELIRWIWEVCGEEVGENALEAQEEILDDVYDGGFAAAILDFRAAMYDLDEFEEGSSYPEVYFEEEDSVEGKGEVAYTGAQFIKLLPGERGEGLSVCFDADDDLTRARVFADRSLVGSLLDGDLLDLSDVADRELVLVVARGAIAKDGDFAWGTSVDDDCDPPGCGRCSSAGGGGAASGAWWLASALMALALRRRR